MSEIDMLDNIPLLMLAIAGAIIVIFGGIAIYYACRHMISLSSDLEDLRISQDARNKYIDQWLAKIERQVNSSDARAPAYSQQRDIDPSSFGETAEPHVKPVASSRQRQAATDGVQAPSYPAPRAAAAPTLLEVAQRALESANSCNRFADEFGAWGFGIDGDGSRSQEPTSTADRGEVLVLPVGGRYAVVPSFNMKRNQGLYTSDAGRAAQTRLGWLFEIERGEKLFALEAAEISRDWGVIKKGRLALPLERS